MRGVSIAVAGLAVCARSGDRYAVAARLFGLADWVASSNRVAVWPPPEEGDYAAQVAATREALGGAEFARATIEGEAMTVDQVTSLIRGEG
jgi:hypothetical protein